MATNPITPTIGRIVLVNAANFEGDSPGIVTRVFSNECVNLMVFPDGGSPYPVSSVQYAEDHKTSGMGISFHWMEYQLKVAEERDPATGATKS